MAAFEILDENFTFFVCSCHRYTILVPRSWKAILRD